MLEKILVAIDDSSASKKAINFSIELAKIFNSKLYGISVAEIPVMGPEFVEIFPKLVSLLEKKAYEVVTFFKNQTEKEKIPCEIFTFSSPAPEEIIVKEAQKQDVNLVIIGKKNGLGTVSKSVIGNVFCDVLVVPEKAVFKLNKILVATDGSVYSQRASKFAVEFSKVLNGEIIALSVAKREGNLSYAEDSVKLVEEEAKKKGVKVENLTLVGEPFLKILEVADEKEVDLIVMGCYGRTGIEKFLMGSVTERVINNSSFPVLVVKKGL